MNEIVIRLPVELGILRSILASVPEESRIALRVEGGKKYLVITR